LLLLLLLLLVLQSSLSRCNRILEERNCRMRRNRMHRLAVCLLWLANNNSQFLGTTAFRSSTPFAATSPPATKPSTQCHLGRCGDDCEKTPAAADKSATAPSESGLWDRRKLFGTILAGCTTCAAMATPPQSAGAIITDETDNFADNYWTSGTAQTQTQTPTPASTSLSNPSDEVTVSVSKSDLQSKGGIGLELGEVEFRTNRRVYVKSVTPGSPAERLGIQKDWVVVSINGETAERTNVEGVAIMIYRAARSRSRSTDDRSENENENVRIRFRNPVVFANQLKDLSSSPPDTVVTTKVAPAGDTTQRNADGSVQSGADVTEQGDQRLSVSQLIPPKMCKRGAAEDDLLEISYVGRVLETGAIFDGSAVMINGEGIAGRGNDVSIFFVLGKQPFGQFPPGWDVGLSGICVGERRRLLVPPVLAYGSKGLPRRGIPPNATLQYDVTLVSLNGLATPQ